MRKNQGLPIIAIISCIVWYVIFKTYPETDLFVSNIFFDGEKFPLNMHFNLFIKIIDRFIEFGCMAIWVAVVMSMFKKEYKKHGIKQYTPLMRKLTYISAVGLFGSVGSVHFIKRYIMRCRPNFVEFFGGPSPFTEIWEFNAYGMSYTSKCVSFVSGHAAIGFLIYAIAFTFPAKSKKRWQFILLGTVVGISFGFIRIIQGQHYLSDVIFSGYVVYFFAMVLSMLFRLCRA